MPLTGDYEPSPSDWVRQQVADIEAAGTTDAVSMNGMSIIVVTNRGARSGKLRKTPVMRVEHAGAYAVVASKGGAPEHPSWYYNMVANPQVELQDGATTSDMTARVAAGEEREQWWERSVAAFPDYADYQKKTDREIPVFIVEKS